MHAPKPAAVHKEYPTRMVVSPMTANSSTSLLIPSIRQHFTQSDRIQSASETGDAAELGRS